MSCQMKRGYQVTETWRDCLGAQVSSNVVVVRGWGLQAVSHGVVEIAAWYRTFCWTCKPQCVVSVESVSGLCHSCRCRRFRGPRAI